jgi:class 3 adenylate cyclase
MAETMSPEAVVAMLREFDERMMAQIFRCGGTVEKYIGDAILAVFGVPIEAADDAANALRCADTSGFRSGCSASTSLSISPRTPALPACKTTLA